MGFLKNTWVSFVQRPASVIYNSVISKMGVRVPEITDYTPNNPFIRDLEIFSGLNEQLGYYIDNNGREYFTDSARLYKSLVMKSKEFDYKIIGNLPYTVDVLFMVDLAPSSNIVVPAGAVTSNKSGSITYRTLASTTILSGQKVSAPVAAEQSTVRTAIAMVTSTGVSNMEVHFTDKIVHNSIVARWNNVAWTSVDTLAYSSPTATHFVQTVDKDGNVMIYFGNGIQYGKIPVPGQDLEVDYKVTLGLAGKVAAGELNTIVSGSPVLPANTTLTVVNPVAAAGGSDVETIDQLKDHISMHNRTIMRAVTKDDYITITKMAPGVYDAGYMYTGYKNILIPIVPVGGGLASTGLIASTQVYLDYRHSPFIKATIIAAGIVKVILGIDVQAFPSYYSADVANAVMVALTDFMSYQQQKINGSVHMSDLYQIIESVPGVDYSNITVLAAEPYARPISTSAPALSWTTDTQPASAANQRWVIEFTSNTTYRLIKNSTIVGTYTTGNLVALPEISFTVNAGAYSAGNKYEFYTYPYNANTINLSESSLPISTGAEISLNVTGGL